MPILVVDDEEPPSDEVDNGLTPEEVATIDLILGDIKICIADITSLGRHRSYALAITQLEQAKHWLIDRKDKPKD